MKKEQIANLIQLVIDRMTHAQCFSCEKLHIPCEHMLSPLDKDSLVSLLQARDWILE